MRSEIETNRAIELYSDMIRRICFLHLKNYADTEDIFQSIFLKYLTNDTQFDSQEHEKAWFIRVTINECKDLLKSFFRKSVPLDELGDFPDSFTTDDRGVLEAVLALPKKNRNVLYLHYYEGYTAPEIAAILKLNVNTVYTLLNRSKKMLKERLGDEI